MSSARPEQLTQALCWVPAGCLLTTHTLLIFIFSVGKHLFKGSIEEDRGDFFCLRGSSWGAQVDGINSFQNNIKKKISSSWEQSHRYITVFFQKKCCAMYYIKLHIIKNINIIYIVQIWSMGSSSVVEHRLSIQVDLCSVQHTKKGIRKENLMNLLKFATPSNFGSISISFVTGLEQLFYSIFYCFLLADLFHFDFSSMFLFKYAHVTLFHLVWRKNVQLKWLRWELIKILKIYKFAK